MSVCLPLSSDSECKPAQIVHPLTIPRMTYSITRFGAYEKLKAYTSKPGRECYRILS